MTSKVLESQKIKPAKISQNKSTDQERVIREFLGIDISEEELKALSTGDLQLEVSKNGEVQKIDLSPENDAQNFKHRLVAYLMARGYSRRQIAEVTGYTSPYVTQLLKKPWLREMAIKFQDKIVERLEVDRRLALARLGEMSQEAVDVLEEGMESYDEDIKFKSAVKVLEGIGLYAKHNERQSIDIGLQFAQIIARSVDGPPTQDTEEDVIDVEDMTEKKSGNN